MLQIVWKTARTGNKKTKGNNSQTNAGPIEITFAIESCTQACRPNAEKLSRANCFADGDCERHGSHQGHGRCFGKLEVRLWFWGETCHPFPNFTLSSLQTVSLLCHGIVVMLFPGAFGPFVSSDSALGLCMWKSTSILLWVFKNMTFVFWTFCAKDALVAPPENNA